MHAVNSAVLEQCQQSANAGRYEYRDVPPAQFSPYQRATEYALGPEQSFWFRQPGDSTYTHAGPTCTVWVHETAPGLWRVYALRGPRGECFLLTST